MKTLWVVMTKQTVVPQFVHSHDNNDDSGTCLLAAKQSQTQGRLQFGAVGGKWDKHAAAIVSVLSFEQCTENHLQSTTCALESPIMSPSSQ